MQQPIFDNCGILTIGYRYPNLHMAESHNAPGSPYWSLKAFAFLMIPDDAPFWQAEIEPLPELEPLKLLRRGEMLVQRRPMTWWPMCPVCTMRITRYMCRRNIPSLPTRPISGSACRDPASASPGRARRYAGL